MSDRHHPMVPEGEKAQFWQWVASRKAHDNPRGDFIRDTRDLLRMGIDPTTHEHRILQDHVIEREYRGLIRQYLRERSGIQPGQTVGPIRDPKTRWPV